MSIAEIADIPADLAEEAARVPGIGVRLVSFLRAEIAQNQKRLRRHSQEARELVEQAKAEAEKLKAEGITREQVMESFEKNYFDILKQF
jgi:predicted  nucleic acid-binding Zn-ribbon protein